ncbi:hypothetical protein EVAR_29197_1 [Eumeta japonica]|uniref:Uncharacterized protein n=1 Tax=Eumeta variegata TaxID=151549 RepID=A0A4C1VBA4_EUMVA|nr:hypothetical protein EVAR_29197_1 [Eumeta japonica]
MKQLMDVSEAREICKYRMRKSVVCAHPSGKYADRRGHNSNGTAHPVPRTSRNNAQHLTSSVQGVVVKWNLSTIKGSSVAAVTERPFPSSTPKLPGAFKINKTAIKNRPRACRTMLTVGSRRL